METQDLHATSCPICQAPIIPGARYCPQGHPQPGWEQTLPGIGRQRLLPHPGANTPSPAGIRERPFLWMIGVVALAVLLTLGLVYILGRATPGAPAPSASSGGAPAPAPTSTSTPTATPPVRVAIQLVDVRCVVTRNIVHHDHFFLKSTLSAPSVAAPSQTTQTKTTGPIDINNGQTKGFAPADQVIFAGTVPLGQRVQGSLTAYTDDTGKSLGTTNIDEPAKDQPEQTHEWHITGVNVLNSWDYYLHWTISGVSLAAFAALGPAGNATIPGGALVSPASLPERPLAARSW